MGAIPSNLCLVIQWTETDILTTWIDEACSMRRKESTSKIRENIAEAEAAKLLILATYGKMLVNPIDFCSTSFDTESCTLKRIKNRDFISADFIGSDTDNQLYFENRRRKSKIVYRSPIQIGFQVLSSAKRHVLELVYYCIKPNLDPRSYQIFCLQTDSVSFMITEDNMELWFLKNVIPGREIEWEKARKKYLVDETGP